jgi:hypothetical protein
LQDRAQRPSERLPHPLQQQSAASACSKAPKLNKTSEAAQWKGKVEAAQLTKLCVSASWFDWPRT